MKIDLDQARAARREKANDASTVVFGGEEFTLPPELPLDIAKMLDGNIIGGMEALLGPEQWARFEAHQPSLNDVMELFQHIGSIYGFGTTGESSAS